MKKFGEGQQPFYAIVDIPEGDAQELTTVTDQVLNSLYGEFFNLLKAHGINPTTTTSADLKQVARAVWSAVNAGSLFVDAGTANVKQLTHVKGKDFLFRNGNSGDNGFIIEFLNKVENTGAVVVNVFDVENNTNHFNSVLLVDATGNQLTAKALPVNSMVKAFYEYANNRFVVVSIYNLSMTDNLIFNAENQPLRTVSVQTVESVAELTQLAKIDKRTVYVKSYHAGPKKGGGFFVYDATKANTNDNGIIFNGWVRVCDRSFVQDSWFGAIGDGVTDDSTALQAAINYCNNTAVFDKAPALEITGNCFIATTLYIDRKTDTTISTFEIFAKGKNCGFSVNKEMFIFDSHLSNVLTSGAYTLAPSSENIKFTNLTFYANMPHAKVYTFSEKFLRIEFDNCRFINIKGTIATEFLQSIKFHKCKHRGHDEYFINCKDGYDIRVSFAEFESAGRGFKFTGLLRSACFDDILYQSSLSPLLNAAGAFCVSINNGYFELNTDSEIYIGDNFGNISACVTISNNIFMPSEALANDSSYYSIRVGNSENIFLYCNSSTANLCDNQNSMPFGVVSVANSTPKNKMILSNDNSKLKEVTPNATTSQADAVKIRNEVNLLVNVPASNAAVSLPSIVKAAKKITIININTSAVNIYPASGERILGFGYDAPATIPANATKTYYASNSDYWLEQ